jgi:uncharacterized membrane protein
MKLFKRLFKNTKKVEVSTPEVEDSKTFTVVKKADLTESEISKIEEVRAFRKTIKSNDLLKVREAFTDKYGQYPIDGFTANELVLMNNILVKFSTTPKGAIAVRFFAWR